MGSTWSFQTCFVFVFIFLYTFLSPDILVLLTLLRCSHTKNNRFNIRSNFVKAGVRLLRKVDFKGMWQEVNDAAFHHFALHIFIDNLVNSSAQATCAVFSYSDTIKSRFPKIWEEITLYANLIWMCEHDVTSIFLTRASILPYLSFDVKTHRAAGVCRDRVILHLNSISLTPNRHFLSNGPAQGCQPAAIILHVLPCCFFLYIPWRISPRCRCAQITVN